MIVCVCQAITENDVIEAVSNNDLVEFFLRRNPGATCGTCLPAILSLIQNNQIENSEHLDDDS